MLPTLADRILALPHRVAYGSELASRVASLGHSAHSFDRNLHGIYMEPVEETFSLAVSEATGLRTQVSRLKCCESLEGILGDIAAGRFGAGRIEELIPLVDQLEANNPAA